VKREEDFPNPNYVQHNNFLRNLLATYCIMLATQDLRRIIKGSGNAIEQFSFFF
jgi:hypothetical protein